jgi:hypothetical protein
MDPYLLHGRFQQQQSQLKLGIPLRCTIGNGAIGQAHSAQAMRIVDQIALETHTAVSQRIRSYVPQLAAAAVTLLALKLMSKWLERKRDRLQKEMQAFPDC